MLKIDSSLINKDDSEVWMKLYLHKKNGLLFKEFYYVRNRGIIDSKCFIPW